MNYTAPGCAVLAPTPSEKAEYTRRAKVNIDRARAAHRDFYDAKAVLEEFQPSVSHDELKTALAILRNAQGSPVSAAELEEFQPCGDAVADNLLLIEHLTPGLSAHQLRRLLDAMREVGRQPRETLGLIALAHVFAHVLLPDVSGRAALAAMDLAAEPSTSRRVPDVSSLVRESCDALVIPRLRGKAK